MVNLKKKKKIVKKKNVRTRALVTRPKSEPTYGLQPGSYAIGDSTVAIPTAYGGRTGNRKLFPLSRGLGGRMMVAKYEQIVSVNAAGGSFGMGGAVINPGLSTNFPWLSTIASNYQSFKIHFMRFIWVPSCPTTTAGTACLYIDYNFNAVQPTTLAQVDMSASGCSGPPWLGSPVDATVAFAADLQVSRCIHVDVDVTKFTQPWYNVRTGNNANLNTGGALSGTIPVGLTFTQGNISDTSGRPATIYWGSNTSGSSPIGLVYCGYDVEFFDPIASALNN